MTARQLIDLAGQHQQVLLVAFCVPPLGALLLRLVHGRGTGGRSPWKYVYGVLVYLVCVPGIAAAVLTAYALFFSRQNLLDVDLAVYGLPLLAMGLTLLIISRAVSFAEVPGFGRLTGLMLMIAVSFALTLALARTRIWLFFGGSIAKLVLLVGGLFAVLKWGAYMAFRRRSDPERPPPSLPLS